MHSANALCGPPEITHTLWPISFHLDFTRPFPKDLLWVTVTELHHYVLKSSNRSGSGSHSSKVTQFVLSVPRSWSPNHQAGEEEGGALPTLTFPGGAPLHPSDSGNAPLTLQVLLHPDLCFTFDPCPP
ncbi:hypothetical protein H8959_009250 [Pygathrix nigripes]